VLVYKYLINELESGSILPLAPVPYGTPGDERSFYLKHQENESYQLEGIMIIKVDNPRSSQGGVAIDLVYY